jgi:hypothetical protein
MSTNVQAVINTVADEADLLLDGIATVSEAKPLLLDWLADNHPELPKTERSQVVQTVIDLLAREGFFAGGAQQEPMSDATEFGEPDD